MADKSDLYAQVKDAIEVLTLKLDRIDKTISKYDGLTTDTDRQR